MATAQNIGLISAPFYADTALDDYQYYCVAAASTAQYVKLATGASEPYALGVNLGNNASARGETTEVCLFGPTIAKVAACGAAGEACPIGVGDFLIVDTNGFLVRAGSDCLANAMALEAITSSCYVANINVFWFGPIAPCVVGSS